MWHEKNRPLLLKYQDKETPRTRCGGFCCPFLLRCAILQLRCDTNKHPHRRTRSPSCECGRVRRGGCAAEIGGTTLLARGWGQWRAQVRRAPTRRQCPGPGGALLTGERALPCPGISLNADLAGAKPRKPTPLLCCYGFAKSAFSGGVSPGKLRGNAAAQRRGVWPRASAAAPAARPMAKQRYRLAAAVPFAACRGHPTRKQTVKFRVCPCRWTWGFTPRPRGLVRLQKKQAPGIVAGA